ncbi:MAG: glutamate synthase [Clostridiales bacterium]|jgi:glutamate synthase domain-containing protein 3|nr:glutamate synthase [Clostridiales bacterium]
MRISAGRLDFKELNKRVKAAPGNVEIEECYGQRFIGSGLSGKTVIINGTPGNALGAYLDGATIIVNGNAQDAVGDTMNDGRIIVDGSAGDALGYAMRGGRIFVRGSAGYRTGIHMKQYQEKKPVIVVGGRVGSFLGEYLAGGLIVVLGLAGESESQSAPVGNFTGTGMHGGLLFIRTEQALENLPAQVWAQDAKSTDLEIIVPYVNEFAEYFKMDAAEILQGRFQVLRPNAKNPYHQLYTAN